MSLDRLSDDDLIQRSRAGEREAFGALVKRHQQRLFHGMVKLLGSTEEARDAVQEAFVLAYQKLETFQGNAAFFTWLFRIAFNAAMSEKRRMRRQVVSLDESSENSNDPADLRSGADPQTPIETRETQELVQSALQSLPEEFRVVLVLKEFEGYCYEEIASLVGIPIGTVRSRIHRARHELREKLRVSLIDSAR